MVHAEITLEFDKIKGMLQEMAVSQRAAEKCCKLTPSLSEEECQRWMEETTEARKILDTFGTPPLAAMKDLEQLLELCQKGAMLLPEQLAAIAQFLSSCQRMRSYLEKAEILQVHIASYGQSIAPCPELREEIETSIRNGRVDSGASPVLSSIRRKLEQAEAQMRAKLETMLRNKKEWFSDSYVSTRSGRLVLPVKKEYKNQVTGTVVDVSGTGGTCFIEPSSVRKLREERESLLLEEENEIRKILYTLSALVDDYQGIIKINREAMETLDFLFAKAKLSQQMKAGPVLVTKEGRTVLHEARHPLLRPDSCVPLEFEPGKEIRGVVITGPNTGGKTVALKTVGLLSMMAQSGLHIPAGRETRFRMVSRILCDIGDGQSISENLSTFSSHITNIIGILEQTDRESLVLLDELGSGTDPAEGMGIAVAILEELRRKNCFFVATTHYPEVKEYAQRTSGLINARMAFDREKLCPLYCLEIGEAGESCALYIAQKLGFPAHLLKIAQAVSGGREEETEGISEQLLDQIFSVQEEKREREKNFSPNNTDTPSAIQGRREKKPASHRERFQLGDSVLVYPKREIGIVFQPANERGEVGVQIQKQKKMISHKRLKLHVPAKELYPPDYDFSVIFDSVADRKARHQMGKRHVPELEILLKKGEEQS